MKKVKTVKPWITYTFVCKECGDKIGYTTKSEIKKDICGKCEGTLTPEC